MNSEPPLSGSAGAGCIVWSPKALTWSMCRFHTCPSSVVMEKVTGPNCFVTVPGIHVDPGRKFLTTTFSPIENSRWRACLSCWLFCSACFPATLLSKYGFNRSNRVWMLLPRNRCMELLLCLHERWCNMIEENWPSDAAVSVHHACLQPLSV